MEIKQHTSEQTLNQRRKEKGNFKNYFETNENINEILICTVLGSNFGEGNGTPLQYSCLENPIDGGAW